MKLRNTVNNDGIWDAEVFDERLAFRHFLLFEFQRSTGIRKRRRQCKRSAMYHGAVPATGGQVVSDCIFGDTVAAENMRIIITEIL